MWISPAPVGSGTSGSHSMFLEFHQFLPGMLKNEETVDQESSSLKTLMELEIRGQHILQWLM